MYASCTRAHSGILSGMSICSACRAAAEITSKGTDELRRAYETLTTFYENYDKTFEEYLKQAKERAVYFHNKCRGGTHCVCQHSVESVMRDV